MRQTDRLEREVPGARFSELRPISARLVARDKGAPKFRPMPGESLKPRGGGRRRGALRLADPAPHSPLLKRIMRRRYAEHPTYPRRIRVFTPGTERERRQPTVNGMRVGREAIPPIVGNPVKSISHRPEARARVSAEAWIAQQEGR